MTSSLYFNFLNPIPSLFVTHALIIITNQNLCYYSTPLPLGLVYVFYGRPLNYLSPRLYQVSLSLNLNFLLESFMKTEYVSQCYVVFFVMQLKSFLSLVSMRIAVANLFSSTQHLMGSFKIGLMKYLVTTY